MTCESLLPPRGAGGSISGSMLTLSNVTKSYGARTLFSDVSLQVNRGERVALVGPNGAGKSTLFSLILRENEPDEGSIVLERGAILGFLPQESAPVGEETVLELATAITPDLPEVRRLLKKHEAGEEVEEHLLHEAQDRFNELNGYQLEAKAKRILKGLAFRDADFERVARTLSGGWIMRAHLARLLVQEPDLLILDEPTNHLDLESLGWFQNYLLEYSGAILLISHDRAFLNALAGSILEIANGRLHRYRGNYDDYLVQKKDREEQQLSAYKNQQKEIQALQEFADRFRAKASKASQAQSKLKQIERMEKIEAPVKEGRHIHFKFPQPQRSGQRVIVLKNVDQSYGATQVYKGMHFESERGDRTVLVGPNGAGKSTLLKILAEVVPIQGGERELGHNTKCGYFAQHRVEMLGAEHTVLEEVLDSPRPVPELMARTVLGAFLFRGDDVFKKVRVLSGGEKSRLALVKLLLDPPNLLLMDEPTTHLDMPSIDALIHALTQFEGTLIFISHDVYFIRELAKQVLHVHAGVLTRYAGGYDYYLEKSKATSEKSGLTASGRADAEAPPVERTRNKSKEQKRLEAEERQAKARARREGGQRVTQIEAEIAGLEAQQKQLNAKLESPETYATPADAIRLNRELAEIRRGLERAMAEWEEVTGKSLEPAVES